MNRTANDTATVRESIRRETRAYFSHVHLNGPLAGREHTIWVQQVRPPSELPEEAQEGFNPFLVLGSPAWDVFDREGRYLGVVQLPERFEAFQFVGDEIYGA